MASGPITSWEIDGETVSDLIFLGSKITADGDCIHEIRRHLSLGWKALAYLDIIYNYVKFKNKIKLKKKKKAKTLLCWQRSI